jgi:hypothetical protein
MWLSIFYVVSPISNNVMVDNTVVGLIIVTIMIIDVTVNGFLIEDLHDGRKYRYQYFKYHHDYRHYGLSAL